MCEKAGRVVERVLADISFDLEVVDITTSSELLQRYGLYIPVITIDGIEFSRYHVNESGFRALLNAKRNPSRLEFVESVAFAFPIEAVFLLLRLFLKGSWIENEHAVSLQRNRGK